MDESLPATSTPVDEPEQDGTVAHDAKAARERRRLRVPTSVLVTFVGIALTAWLLPALTHQWDDRQNSQELKAAIVADIATATAQALVGGEAIWAKPPRPVNRAKLADDWSRASLRIEARLRAYFGPPIIAAWQIYTWFVDRFVDGRRGQARAALLAASRSLSGNPLVGGGLVDLDPGAAYALAGVLKHRRRPPGGMQLPIVRDKRVAGGERILQHRRLRRPTGSRIRSAFGAEDDAGRPGLLPAGADTRAAGRPRFWLQHNLA